MNSIQHYIINKDHFHANQYLSDFAALIRVTLESAQETFVDLEKELARIRLYLSLEQLRFSENELEYEISVETDIDDIKIPNMIIQPYVENAILHGIVPKNGPGKVTINVVQEDESHIKIVIRDNGIGIEKSKQMKKESGNKHIGMEITAQRLQLLEQLIKKYYRVNVHNEMNNNEVAGTVVELIVPVNADKADIDLTD